MSLPAVILNMTADEDRGCHGASKPDKMSMLISLRNSLFIVFLFFFSVPSSAPLKQSSFPPFHGIQDAQAAALHNNFACFCCRAAENDGD